LLCFSLALWNGKDPILKERAFGLNPYEGNHGEDVKEYYFYLDSTPTHSYMRYLYKYPQGEFPYQMLVEENTKRGGQGPEFELLDTGIFDEDRYFDVFVEYAKAGPNDICIRIEAFNRGPDKAQLHLLPHLWFRNIWSWGDQKRRKPSIRTGRRQVASAHFLGALHLDEIQNLFKLATLKRRNKRTGTEEAPELSIVEDQLLKWILTLMNTWQVPLIVSGTLDGMAALTRRLSTTERIVTTGYHQFQHFENATDTNFKTNFLEQLGKYQYVQKKMSVNGELAELIIELTGGIQRLIIALWIAAHRVALERGKGDLLLTDFKMAAATYLAPVAPAVAALRSKDPTKMSKYEDLLPRDNMFWTQFWGTISQI
jgi:hypothetical protein